MKVFKVLFLIFVFSLGLYGILAYLDGNQRKIKEHLSQAKIEHSINPEQEAAALNTQLSNPWVAKYDDIKIYKSEVSDKLKLLFGGKLPGGAKDFFDLPKDMQKSILEKMIIAKMILNESRKTDIENRSLFKLKLVDAKNELIQKEFITDIMKRAASEKNVKKAYGEMIAKLNKQNEFELSHILTINKEDALAAEQELKKGAKFPDVAAKYSVDASKARGGKIGTINEDKLPKESYTILDNMKKGEISPPIETKFGWHIFLVEDKKPRKIPSFEDVQEKLALEIGGKAVTEYIDGKIKTDEISYTLNPINKPQ